MEEAISAVTETPVERAVRPAAQTTPYHGLMESTTSTFTQVESLFTTTTTSATAALHAPLAPSVIPVEPMPSPLPGVPSPYHAVDFCVPIGPDFSLVTGLSVYQLITIHQFNS